MAFTNSIFIFRVAIFSFLFTFNFSAATQKRNKNGNFLWRHNLTEQHMAKCQESIRFPCFCSFASSAAGESVVSLALSVRCTGANSLEHILSALGPLSRWPNARLDLFRMEHSPMPVLYLESLRVLPPIRRLQLHNNSLAHLLLHHRPLNSAQRQTNGIFDTLEELAITSNELANFGHFSSAIAPLRSLRSLSLSANRLREVPAHIFLHFHSRNLIENLDLSANSLRDNSIPPEAFLGLGSLQKLSLDRNQLHTVPVKAINELGDSLEELFLGKNQIDGLMPTGEGLALARLKTLSLEGNKISAIDGEFFRGIPSLFYLNLSDNRFSAVTSQMFAFIRRLKVLEMNRNPISRLDAQTFHLVPSLLRLELAQCHISQIDADTFGTVPKLQFIHLGGNRMSSIEWHHFAGKLPFLVSLDLSNNLISHTDQSAFANLAQLQSLNLGENRIKSLAKNTFDGTFIGLDNLSNAREINLSGNPLDCRTFEGTEWAMGVAEGVTLRGSCEEPTELSGVPLANKRQLIKWWTDRTKSEERRGRPMAKNGGGSSGNWSSTARTTTEEAKKGEKKDEEAKEETMGEKEKRQREKGKREGKKEMGKAMGNGSQTEQIGATEMGTAAEGQTEQNCEGSDAQRHANVAVFVLVVVFIVVGVLLTAFLCCRQLVAPLPPDNRCSFPTNSRPISGKKNSQKSWDKLKVFFAVPFCPPGRCFSIKCEKRSDPRAIPRHWHNSDERKRNAEVSIQNGENEPYFWPMFWDKTFLEEYPQKNLCQNEQMGRERQQQKWRVSREMFWF
ncbi:hypothetical protein niasHS_014591 [Heterodera schachtii]|uniref:Uncharacterized protein n=1 Tax=Heterodera schachtii TaxID=97005 RepID=A0ABD2IF23_HETSC